MEAASGNHQGNSENKQGWGTVRHQDTGLSEDEEFKLRPPKRRSYRQHRHPGTGRNSESDPKESNRMRVSSNRLRRAVDS